MSGGSLDYAYSKIEDVVRAMNERESDLTPKMRAFRAFLVKVAKAAHDVEWEIASDYGPGESDAAIDAVMPVGFDLACAIESAKIAEENLHAAIAEAELECE